MSHSFLDKMPEALSSAKATPETFRAFLDEANFFFKCLKVKLESGNPELQQSALQELKEFQEHLSSHHSR